MPELIATPAQTIGPFFGYAERRAMMAVREANGTLRFDVYLQGPRETPFRSFPGHLR